MIDLIEALPKSTVGDGSAHAVEADTAPEGSDVDQLLEAWFQERGRSNESSLLLGLVGNLLIRVVTTGQFTEKNRREARRLLRAINVISR